MTNYDEWASRGDKSEWPRYSIRINLAIKSDN